MTVTTGRGRYTSRGRRVHLPPADARGHDATDRRTRLTSLIRSGPGRLVANNLGYRVAALIVLALATVLVARSAGAAGVGHYALWRVLPWLAGTVLTVGLEGSIVYYLAGQSRDHAAVRGTILATLFVATPVGTLTWVLAAPLIGEAFFSGLTPTLVAAGGLLVITRMVVLTAKVAAQGMHDLAGSNRTHFLEGAAFVPWYAALIYLGVDANVAIVSALILADLTTTAVAWRRLIARGFLHGLGLPSFGVARRMCAFGIRMNMGEWLYLLNLRLNVVLIGAIAGPSAVGIYAVATRFAETLQMPGMAMNYVLMPRFSGGDAQQSAAEARTVLPRAFGLAVVAAVPLALSAGVILPFVFGAEFAGASLPARILLVGLVIDSAGAVAMAYLYGRGRPGVFAGAAAAGLIVTITLDLLLIPPFGAAGAAWASTTSYALAASMLILAFHRHASALSRTRGAHRRSGHRASSSSPSAPAPSAERSPSGRRLPPRVLDVVAAALALVILAPFGALVAIAIRLTSPGPALFWQERVGLGGRRFEMAKFRTMFVDAERRGGQLTVGGRDPRITRVGALLRSIKLDELPQLFNVVRGDMRLVGPRPEVPRYVHCYTHEQRTVLSVRPGITDPASVAFRDENELLATADDPERLYVDTIMPHKLTLNLAYLERRTLVADLKVIVSTVALAVLRVRTPRRELMQE